MANTKELSSEEIMDAQGEELIRLNKEVKSLKEELLFLATLFENRIVDLQRENNFYKRR
tara:strand:- start:630 stop:806 length:177 start_codon:yes stop_codon:yes gene_type:complete